MSAQENLQERGKIYFLELPDGGKLVALGELERKINQSTTKLDHQKQTDSEEEEEGEWNKTPHSRSGSKDMIDDQEVVRDP